MKEIAKPTTYCTNPCYARLYHTRATEPSQAFYIYWYIQYRSGSTRKKGGGGGGKNNVPLYRLFVGKQLLPAAMLGEE